MKLRVFVLLLIACTSLRAQQPLHEVLEQYNTRSVPYTTAEQVKMRQLNNTVVLLDAREPNEFLVSHLPGAVHIGFSNFAPHEVAAVVPHKDTPIVVYCSLGIRSEEISEKLKKSGYTQVKNLYGGIFEWKNKGFRVVNRYGKATDSVHVFSKHWGQWLTNGIKITE